MAIDPTRVIRSSGAPSPLAGEGWGEGDSERFALSLTLSHQGRGDWLRRNLKLKLTGEKCRINKRIFLFFATLLLTACGFHLRGQANMPFQSFYLIAPSLNTPFVNELRRNLTANKVTLANTAEQADVVIDIVSENTEKQVLSLGGDGRVNEYRLIYHVSLRAYNHQQQEWIPAEDMSLRRDFSYDDTQILAKEAEETLLYQSMRSDMVQQILRRLSHAKPTPLTTP